MHWYRWKSTGQTIYFECHFHFFFLFLWNEKVPKWLPFYRDFRQILLIKIVICVGISMFNFPIDIPYPYQCRFRKIERIFLNHHINFYAKWKFLIWNYCRLLIADTLHFTPSSLQAFKHHKIITIICLIVYNFQQPLNLLNFYRQSLFQSDWRIWHLVSYLQCEHI